MQKVFADTRILDKSSVFEFLLTEDILMENAASGLLQEIIKCGISDKKILIICGSGDNGGDGLVLARKLCNANVCVYQIKEPKSNACKIQYERAKKTGVRFTTEICDADIIVDCLFGSGFHGAFDENLQGIIEQVNKIDAYKISCDIPSGVDAAGNVLSVDKKTNESVAFRADVTLTMGALKLALLSDNAKQFVGQIKCVDLGIPRNIYEQTGESDTFLLEKSDLQLPVRNKLNVNKGSFGHTAIYVGDKPGAAIIAGTAALAFGSGLVSLIGQKDIFTSSGVYYPAELMRSDDIPQNATCLAIGMGLGTEKIPDTRDLSVVLDANIFNRNELVGLLEKKKNCCVLTPHPKEFSSLLKLTGIGDYSVKEIQSNRLELVKLFCKKYPEIVLLLKGANPIIGLNDKYYINNLGNQSLAKGGSGDVLSGLIASLISQSYSPLQAAISASLAHAIASTKLEFKNNYSLTPFSLIDLL